VDLYRSLLRNHISPYLGGKTLGELDAAAVRRWRTNRLDAGTSATTTAKAYRLLRAVMTTAVDDGIIPRNSCRIRGAGSEPTTERPVLSVEQVFALAGRMPNDRLAVFVLVTTFGSLRWGEVTALRRMDIDIATGTLHIRTAMGRRYSRQGRAGRAQVPGQRP
jgi:integrase